jgi:muramoyltetrapeptide carboxypeptidase
MNQRLAQLQDALMADDCDIIMAARGGYGASELLPHLPWKKLSSMRPKLVIGFSDISALHGAIDRLLGWPCLHGPMPGTDPWTQNLGHEVDQMMEMIRTQTYRGRLSLLPKIDTDNSDQLIQGRLWGGCLSVLTNLIGTPFAPLDLKDRILFFEDIGENPARVMRFWNQWLQSGLIDQARAVVLGRFLQTGDEQKGEAMIREQIQQRTRVPVFVCEGFGHGSPNYPILIGAMAKIDGAELNWQSVIADSI